MGEYIKIPKSFNQNIIYSKNLKDFFAGLTAEDYIGKDEITLEYLREYYKKNKYKTLIIIKELKCRGFKFKEDNQTEFLTTVKILDNYNKYIYTDTNNQKYKNINRFIFDFLDYSTIKSDRYFNGIPLMGFKNYDETLEESLLEKEFKSYGFSIVGLDEYKAINKNLEYSSSKIIQELTDIAFINNIDFEEITNINILDFEYLNNNSRLYKFIIENKIFLLEDFIMQFDLIDKSFFKFEFNYLINEIIEFTKDYYKIEKSKNSETQSIELKKDISITNINEFNENNISYKDLERLKTIHKDCEVDDFYINIRKYLNDLNASMKEILNFNQLIKKTINTNKIGKRQFSMCEERYISKKTLEEIAKKSGITRERVRQIILKVEKLFLSNEMQESIKENLEGIFFDRIVDFNKIDILLKEEYKFLGEVIKQNRFKVIKYYPLTDRVYLSNENWIFDIKNMDKKLDNTIDKIDIIGDYENLIKEFHNFEEELGPINDYIINKIFEKYSIRVIEDQYIILKDLRYDKDRLELYMKEINKESIDFSNNELIAKMNKDFSNIFGKNYNKTSRTWEGIASRIDDIIQVDPRTYKHIVNLEINFPEIDFVKNKIDEYLDDIDFIFADKLYLDLKNNYDQTTISSKHEMYSLIKYFYANELNFATGNSLKFSKIDTLQKSNTDIIYDICSEKKGIVTFKEISDKTKWNKHRIEMAISNSDDIIKFGSEKCIIADNLFINNEKELLQNKINTFFKDKFTTSELILESLIFSEDLSGFIFRNNINDNISISNLVKHLNNDIEGHTVFLYKKDSSIKSLRDLIISRFNNSFTRNDFVDLLKEFKYSENSINTYLTRLTDSNSEEIEYLPISVEEYVRIDNFKVESDFVEKIVEYFEAIYYEQEYVIPNIEINNIRNIIGSTKYGLNQYIISNILIRNGYKKVYRYNESFRNEIMVLVKKDSVYDTLDHLVYDILKNNYDGELHEVHVHDFLSNKGFYNYENDKSKKTINEDVISELIKVDIAGRVILKEAKND